MKKRIVYLGGSITCGAHRATLTTLPPHPDSVGSTVSIAAFLVD